MIYVSDDSNGTYDNETGIWTIGDLPVGETVTLTIKTIVNTSNVTTMYWMFLGAGAKASTFNLGDISSWDVSKVTDFSYIFGGVGMKSTTYSIEGFSNWDTSSGVNFEIFTYSFNQKS